MKYFAGMDVSLEVTAVCVVDETGRMVKEARAASEPDALHALLGSLNLSFERVGQEACSLTAWLHSELTSAGWPAICIESRHAKAAMGAMPNKTQIMRTGWFKAVHVKTPTCRSWRSLLVARRAVLNEMRTIENVVRAILRESGLKLGTPARKDFIVCARELIAGERGLTMMIEPLLEILVTMLREFTRLTKLVLVIVRDESICHRLMSAPGVGPLTALAFRATIDRPERFAKSRDVGAHRGLTPRRYQSVKRIFKGGLADVVMNWRQRRFTRRPIRFWFAARNGQPREHGHEVCQTSRNGATRASRSYASSQRSCIACG
jgi:transposase